MHIYKLSRTSKPYWDEVDAMVIIADSEDHARSIARDHCTFECDHCDDSPCNWQDQEFAVADCLGDASESMKPGLVLRSFNAG